MLNFHDWLTAVICSTWSLNHSHSKVNEYVVWYALNFEECTIFLKNICMDMSVDIDIDQCHR
jgi:hypothetical protein